MIANRAGAVALGLLLVSAAACRDDDEHDHDPGDADADTDADADADTDADTDTDTDIDTSDPYTHYEFASRFGPGSSVAYDGQIFRHLLIHDLNKHLGGLTARIDSGFYPAPGEITAELDFYFSFDGSTAGNISHLYAASLPTLQSTYDDVSSGKDLVGKIAGNAAGGHRDFSTEFAGWPHPEVSSPESLVRLWFAELDALAVQRSNGVIPIGPDGAPVSKVYLTADGRDLQQLLNKFLGVSIAFWQGADWYLDDETPGKGILGDNAAQVAGKPYSELEHLWDEGFGYFGASRNYGAWSIDLIAGAAHDDTFVVDGSIDLLSEVAWGHSGNAAKRDRGAVVPTTIAMDAWEGFVSGRMLITAVGDNLSASELAELQAYRDQAVRGWERAIAATVVHYINDTLQDMNAFGTAAYSFADHAKHWSEMKGFALGLQFNPRSPLSHADFVAIHDLFGTAPVLPDAPYLDGYRAGLIEARTILGAAYDFDPANLGDANGENGW